MFSVMDQMNNFDGNEQGTSIPGPFGPQLGSHDDSFDIQPDSYTQGEHYIHSEPYVNGNANSGDSYVNAGYYGTPIGGEYISNPVYNQQPESSVSGISIPGQNYQSIQPFGMTQENWGSMPGSNFESSGINSENPGAPSTTSVDNNNTESNYGSGMVYLGQNSGMSVNTGASLNSATAHSVPHQTSHQAQGQEQYDLPLGTSGSSSIYSLTPMNSELYQNASVQESAYDSFSASSSFFDGIPNSQGNDNYTNYNLNNNNNNNYNLNNNNYNSTYYPNYNSSTSNFNAASYSSPPVSSLSHTVNFDLSQHQPSEVTKYSRRNSYKRPSNPSLATPVTPVTSSPRHLHQKNSRKRYRVIRGTSAGGASTRQPKVSPDNDSTFLPVVLDLQGAGVEDICYPQWSSLEKEDRRRIIRIERTQIGPKLVVNFSIIGGANQHPTTLPPPEGVDVLEVSCLECVKPESTGYDSSSDEDSSISPNHHSANELYQYFITSVEVVEIVEMLIGTQLHDPAERRRERGRVRSNLVPFWLKKPISSRMNDSSNPTSTSSSSSSSLNQTNQDSRVELAKRIMAYEIRKPRGFDKEVRILRWDKLVPALKRALQSYYTEIPRSDTYVDFDV